MSKPNVTKKATPEKGVYEVVSDKKTFKRGPDICYYIAFRLEGRLTWEKIGWASEGFSIKLASEIRSERLRSMRFGFELPQQKKKAMTFGKLAEKYLAWATQTKCRKGIDDKSRYENHLKERFENKRLDEIQLLDLERMKFEMSKQGLTPKTIAHCLGLMRSMYNWGTERSIFDGPNPVKKCKMPVIQNARDRFLSVEEAQTLLGELRKDLRSKERRDLKDTKLHDIALISLHTGARASEIFNLRGQDIDLKNGLIALRDTKNTETRYAPVTRDVREVLRHRMPSSPNDLVFTNEKGRKIKEVSNSFQRVVDRLGFNNGVTDPRQRVVFHTLRHSFASWLAIQGTPILTIARLMGHKSLAMSERYSHLSPDHKRDAVNGIEAAFNQKIEVAKNEK